MRKYSDKVMFFLLCGKQGNLLSMSMKLWYRCCNFSRRKSFSYSELTMINHKAMPRPLNCGNFLSIQKETHIWGYFWGGLYVPGSTVLHFHLAAITKKLLHCHLVSLLLLFSVVAITFHQQQQLPQLPSTPASAPFSSPRPLPCYSH